MENNLQKVGKYNKKWNEKLEYDINDMDIYISNGLKQHMKKRKHFKALKYIENISDIINNPDYIGKNPNENGMSMELVKEYDDNILVGIKLDCDGEYLYISTMFDIQESKIKRRLHSGRLKKIKVDNCNKM